MYQVSPMNWIFMLFLFLYLFFYCFMSFFYFENKFISLKLLKKIYVK